MKGIAAGCTVIVLASASAGAQTDAVRIAPPPAWVVASPLMDVPAGANGLLFVRRQDTVVHLEPKGQQQYTGYRIKILHPDALQLGNVAITWNPAAGSPSVHAIRIYRDGQVIDVLKSSSFEILRREGQLEAAQLTGNLTAVLRVPDLRVGDEIETSLTLKSDDPTLGDKVAGVLALGASPQPGRFTMAVTWDKGFQPTLKPSADLAAAARRDDRSLTLTLDNPRLLSPPKDSPPRYAWQRTIEYSRFADWAGVSRHFAPLYRRATTIATDSSLTREARRIADANPRPFDRAAAALRLVQQDVRYIYVGLDGGNLTPATADETWQRRYGDCKGKTVLLLALLGAMGIDAEPVLVNSSGNDDGFAERLPNPGLFDHVLVRATIDGKPYWLDGTLPAVVGPSTDPFLPYRSVLPLTPAGSTLEVRLWQPLRRPEEVDALDLDSRAGFDQPTRVTDTHIIRGIKALQQQDQLSSLTDDQRLTAFRQALVGETWRTVDAVDWRYDPKVAASVLTIKGTWKLDWTDDGGGAKSYALPGGGFSPPDRRGRSADQDQQIPFYNKPGFDCYVTTLHLPATTRPSQWYTKGEYDNHIFGKEYYRAFQIRDDSIRMIRGFRTERIEIGAAAAERDNARLPSFDNSMAWVNFDPKGNYRIDRRATDVPTATGADWATDDAPCLAPAQPAT